MMKHFPQLSHNAGFGAIFAIGVLTSFHCVGMCGGIALSQSVRSAKAQERTDAETRYVHLLPSIQYQAGRVFSYTALGGLAGGLGQAVRLPGAWSGLVPLLGGLFMVIMGINLLGIFKGLRRFNLRMPYFAAKKITGGARLSPLGVGLLSGLMPCGPLQIIQLYALGTGSFLYGGISALVFALGTVPLLLLFGAFNAALSKRFSEWIMKASAIFVIVLGFFMFERGLALTGITSGSEAVVASGDKGFAKVEGNGSLQTVTTTASDNDYPPIVVQKGVPVRWNLRVDADHLNNCNHKVRIPEFHIEKELSAGDNIIEFTPPSEGKFVYSCWMGMIKSSIVVVEDLNHGPDTAVETGATQAGCKFSFGEGDGESKEAGSLSGSPLPSLNASAPSVNTAAIALPEVGSSPVPTASPVPASSPAASSKPEASNLPEHSGASSQSVRNAGQSEEAQLTQHMQDSSGKAPEKTEANAAVGSGIGIAVVDGSARLQTVESQVGSDSYTPVTVQKGIPVKWIIRAKENQLNDCNKKIRLPDFQLEKELSPGENIVEFTPKDSGEFVFTCWMDMIESKITVVDDLSRLHGGKP